MEIEKGYSLKGSYIGPRNGKNHFLIFVSKIDNEKISGMMEDIRGEKSLLNGEITDTSIRFEKHILDGDGKPTDKIYVYKGTKNIVGGFYEGEYTEINAENPKNPGCGQSGWFFVEKRNNESQAESILEQRILAQKAIGA